MALVESRDPTVPVDAACAALGVSRASLYRARNPSPPPTVAAPRAPRQPKRSEAHLTCGSAADDHAKPMRAGCARACDSEGASPAAAPSSKARSTRRSRRSAGESEAV